MSAAGDTGAAEGVGYAGGGWRRRSCCGSLIAGVMITTGCSSLSTPVLRHETGETLGTGKIKAGVNFETSRLYPLVPATASSATVEQNSSVYHGAFFGLYGAVGIHPRIDIQLRTYNAFAGGGWRLGAKINLLAQGRWAVATMFGYGRYSGKGTTTFQTAGQPEDLDQTLSAYNLDLGIPISYRFTPVFALFSGITVYRSGVTGSSGDSYVEATTHDLGVNLGAKFNFGRFEADAEFALLRLYDPFLNTSWRFMPYWGISGGVLF